MSSTIKIYNIPRLTKAVKQAGATFDNTYFDIYHSVKDAMSRKNGKLEYMARQPHTFQPNTSRAWCNPKANMGG